jgi:putative ABC transport system substrate-binding protein
LVNPDDTVQAAAQTEQLQAAARALDLHLQIAKASNPVDIADAFATLAHDRVEALQIGVDPLFGNHIDQVVALAQRNKIPTVYPWREFTVAGGLMNYGASIPDAYRQVGVYTGQILKGANPAELPVQRPTKLKLVINLKAARAIGTKFPAKLIALADEVIE